MVEVVLIIAVIGSICQLLAGIGGIIENSSKFSRNKGQLANYREVDDGYYNVQVENLERELKENAMWARRFGLIALSSPFFLVLAPVAIVLAIGYVVKENVIKAVPVLTYKGE